MQLRFHTQTAGVSLTAQQPEVNIVRTAIEALAGVLGGTQSLHTNSMDEALALPTERAARIALRTQQVIAHETNVAHVADPLGGSYFVEALTDEMERQAEEIFAHLDELGDGSMLDGAITRDRGELVPGRDRRLGVRARTQVQRRPPDRRRREPVHRRQRRRRDRHCCEITNEDEARQLKRLERGAATTATATPSNAALAALAAEAADPEVNLMPTLIDGVERLRHARRDHGHARRRLRPSRRSADDLVNDGLGPLDSTLR